MAETSSFIFALDLLSSEVCPTVPLGLMQSAGQHQSNVPTIMASLTPASLPAILVYLLAHERVVAGLVAGALKD